MNEKISASSFECVQSRSIALQKNWSKFGLHPVGRRFEPVTAHHQIFIFALTNRRLRDRGPRSAFAGAIAFFAAAGVEVCFAREDE